jgi:hypothetical protein
MKDTYLKFGGILINKDATKGVKVKTGLLGRKNGCKIPNIEKSMGKI